MADLVLAVKSDNSAAVASMLATKPKAANEKVRGVACDVVGARVIRMVDTAINGHLNPSDRL